MLTTPVRPVADTGTIQELVHKVLANEPIPAAQQRAAKAGITAAKSFAIRLVGGHAVAIKRFDRVKQGRRHALSARVALKAAGEQYGYPELAQVLRRRGSALARALR